MRGLVSKSVSSSSYNYFRGLLAKARKDAKLTQAELATRLQRPQSYISKYESGERRLDIIEFLEVAESLDIDPLDLIRELQDYKGNSKNAV